ncbi:HAD superfamily, subfamily IIIB acid phosphatase [Actinidia rufa]|uniref:HAD superfamily, subfamily IIIB acid phosphatase n=1 Tax=Actinidia rufa TaxID=165716 RepID=A0A7J0DF68_9ERIC|nr:HAD superfamily, subfamily IIIB acid phosphatase [Actinidia rufa]
MWPTIIGDRILRFTYQHDSLYLFHVFKFHYDLTNRPITSGTTKHDPTAQKRFDSPEPVGRVVRHIGEQRLVDVENPGVLAVSGDLHRIRKRQRASGGDVRVGPEPVTGHVLLHVLLATRRDLTPRSGVVGLDGENRQLSQYKSSAFRLRRPSEIGSKAADLWFSGEIWMIDLERDLGTRLRMTNTAMYRPVSIAGKPRKHSLLPAFGVNLEI